MNCSTVLHNRMLLFRMFLLRENYTTVKSYTDVRADTSVEQHSYTVSGEIRTPVERNLQFFNKNCFVIGISTIKN